MGQGRAVNIESTPIQGLMRIEPHTHQDQRGKFMRLFNFLDLAQWFDEMSLRQVNLSENPLQWTLRGLHYQYPPACEGKIIACLKGSVLDVAVDLRQGSPSFLQWHAEELSQKNQRMLLLPKGFAHGFMSLVPDTHLIYMHSGDYHPQLEAGIRYDDPRLGIHWPATPTVLSQRDRSFAPLDDTFKGISP